MDKLPIKDFSVSTVCGCCVGVAAKRLTRDAMYGAGCAVILLQTLSYVGYIEINWRKIEKDAVAKIDQDGDGKLTASDAKAIIGKFLGVMKHGMPNAAGFTTGFYLSLKWF